MASTAHTLLAALKAPGAARLMAMALCAVVLAGCHQDMWNQPAYRALRPSELFDDNRSTRPPVPGTVMFGQPMLDTHYYTGMIDGDFARELPDKVLEKWELRALLERGQERYEIHCAVCHGYTGYGNGMAVMRGFKQPTIYHFDPAAEDPERLLKAGPGYIFDVITNGFGTMYSYKAKISVEDRWAIAAYIKALQLSQNIHYDELTDAEKRRVEQSIGEG